MFITKFISRDDSRLRASLNIVIFFVSNFIDAAKNVQVSIEFDMKTMFNRI